MQSTQNTMPPEVDLVPARYIFFVNVPARMRENSDDLYITLIVPIVILQTVI